MTQDLSTTTATPCRRSLDRWLTMWNADSALAREICADDFRIRFAVTEEDGSTPADDIRSSDDFARYLDWWRPRHPTTVFTAVADAIDGRHGRLLWDVEVDGRVAGGLDVFDFDRDGRVSRVWSVGGRRSLRG
jgi:hypothetical protein